MPVNKNVDQNGPNNEANHSLQLLARLRIFRFMGTDRFGKMIGRDLCTFVCKRAPPPPSKILLLWQSWSYFVCVLKHSRQFILLTITCYVHDPLQKLVLV